MTDTLLALVPVYGPWLIACCTFLSCLAVPIPSSLMMLAAGGFAASGELAAWQVVLGAQAGVTLGDQTGYSIGRRSGQAILERVGRAPQRRKLVDRATAFLNARGPWAVFFSRWLVSPVGPYVTYAAGAAALSRIRFSLAALPGELIWVSAYTTVGYSFADNLSAASDLLGNALGLMAALAAVLGLGLWLRAALHQRPKPE